MSSSKARVQADRLQSGKNVGEEFLRVAQKNKINKVTYKLARITTSDEKEFEKTALVTKVKKYICAVGYYSN